MDLIEYTDGFNDTLKMAGLMKLTDEQRVVFAGYVAQIFLDAQCLRDSKNITSATDIYVNHQ